MLNVGTSRWSKDLMQRNDIWVQTALSPALFALSVAVRASWHIWIDPSPCGLTIQSQNNLSAHSWAPLGSALLAAPPPLRAQRKRRRQISHQRSVMTKFSYSEYLSQFRNAGGKCNNVVSRRRGDGRRGDGASDEPEWVFCYGLFDTERLVRSSVSL